MTLPAVILQGILARSALVVLRIYLGVVFLTVTLSRAQPDYLSTPAKGHSFYQAFVQQLVLPNASVFVALVTWSGLLVGVCLILGLLTRLAAAFALALSVNDMLAKGAWFWTPSSSDAACVAIALALLIGAAGRTFGVDGLLARRWPRSPLW
jgi:uncharacterized membrane protein YphA (DoxX/SURF4 family)